ncbi:hypothetical protein Hanom_Chr13g01225011 [Helianthus anomalus]
MSGHRLWSSAPCPHPPYPHCIRRLSHPTPPTPSPYTSNIPVFFDSSNPLPENTKSDVLPHPIFAADCNYVSEPNSVGTTRVTNANTTGSKHVILKRWD